uniref:Uncharacterized protein n=1 Tax=Solanum lycopersicum TaxID=4081 RepID=A0A494G9R6_SOLLC
MNAVKAYFNRNWTREDLVNTGEVSEYAYTSLTTVYLNLFCAMLNFTFGSFLHLIIWEVGGLFTVLSSVASLLWLYFASPLRVRLRLSLLMYAACTLGASFGLFTKYLFEIYPPISNFGKHSLLAVQPYCQPFGSFNLALGLSAFLFMV